jgi:NifU-like protein involved in Fe-S cluster formation
MIKIKKTKREKSFDIIGKNKVPWIYSDIVREHFFNPKNFLKPSEEKNFKYNAYGEAGSVVCGDLMKFWLWIDPKTEKIKKAKWRTFGCGSAIASTSMLSVMITEKGGMPLDKVRKIKPQDIMKRLGGLPIIKIHCSVLGDEALKAAIKDYGRQKNKNRQK